MFRAYRYRLEYSGRRERLREIYDSNLSLASISNPVTSQSFKWWCIILWSNWIKKNVLFTCSVLYTSLVSFEVLLFSTANWIVSSDHRSINMSVASLLQMHIRGIFLAAKSTRFWRPRAHFRPQSLRFRGRVVSAKTLGTRMKITSSFGTRTSF